MIHLMDILCYSKKKLHVLIFLLMGYVMWISYVTYQLWIKPDEVFELIYLYNKLTHQMIFSMIPFLVGWLWMDLEHPHDKVFITLSYPRYHWDMKWIYISLMSGLYIVIFYLIWMIIPALWIPRLTLNIHLLEPFHLWLDMLILYLFSHGLLSEKTKSMTLIFPLLYVIFKLMMQDQTSLILYYFLPLYQREIITFRLALTYKLWYIGLGFILIRYFYGKTARNG